jgi:ribonuclease D
LKKKANKIKAEERKQANLMLQERMKQPLNGNLALNFLFKDQDITEIVKLKNKDGSGNPMSERS